MNRAEQSINHVLVCLFNDIMSIEERALTTGEFSDASVREMHVLEAVGAATAADEENSMSAIAARLGVTVGTLTVAATTLERKGYLLRGRAAEDKRIVRLRLTPRGRAANARHARFHAEMVADVQKALTGPQLTALVEALDRISVFFEQYMEKEC
jgi:DNA-binding MarR family transcriptional regulator